MSIQRCSSCGARFEGGAGDSGKCPCCGVGRAPSIVGRMLRITALSFTTLLVIAGVFFALRLPKSGTDTRGGAVVSLIGTELSPATPKGIDTLLIQVDMLMGNIRERGMMSESHAFLFFIVLSAIAYWIGTRFYIAMELTGKGETYKAGGDAVWTDMSRRKARALPIGKTLSLSFLGIFTLWFIGIVCGSALCLAAAAIEMVLQGVFRLASIIVLTLSLFTALIWRSWYDTRLFRLKAAVRRFLQLTQEFFNMPVIILRELTWWVVPMIPYRYLRFSSFVRFDRFPPDSEKEVLKPALLSAWFSYDLWRSLTFFNERPYPDISAENH